MFLSIKLETKSKPLGLQGFSLPSALNFMVYTFTKTTNWVLFQAIQEDVFLRIIDIISEHGAECAFPTTTISVPDGIELKNKLAS